MKDIKEKLRRFHEEMREGDRKVTPKMLRTLMDNIDFESVMAKLGIEVRSCGKDEYVGYCPNHLQHSSQPPSDPKWYVNSRTGLTYCMTKSVGSNLIEIAKYVLGLDTNRQAYEALLSGRPVEVKIHVEKREEPEPEKDNADRLAESISSVMPFFMNPVMTDGCLEYFAKDGISKDTLEEYGVVACEYGKYRDRALIPFLKENDEICGYIAVDTLGKEAWAESNARRLCAVDSSLDFEACKEELAKKYRKTLYAPGFESRHHLYGLYEKPDFMEDTSEVLLVEGERDALKMLQEGIRCLGCHGTSIKEEQKIMLNKILANTKRLFLGFDMDEAGDKATEKAAASLAEIIDADKIYVINFPPDKKTGEKRDPKKFTGEQMRWLMDRAVRLGTRGR